MRERDINRPEGLLEFAEPEAVLGACRWFDEQRAQSSSTVGSGLLVSVIREGGKPGYRQPRGAAVVVVTSKLLNTVRGRCLSPDGCRRSEVFDMFERAAKMRGLSVSELIDQAMGPKWQLTPPHPAMLQIPGRTGRYNAWLADQGRDRPDLTVVRELGESVLSFASRFWRWQETDRLREGK